MVHQKPFSSATETVVTCVHCGLVPTREESSIEISLDFLEGEKNGLKEKRRIEGQKTKLESCLKYFVREIDLPDYCYEASGRLGATRQVQIPRPSEMLCFQVQCLIWTLPNKKSTGHVESSVCGLCMQPHCITSIKSDFWPYDMVALITQKGHCFRTGHYECFCLKSVKISWCLSNNSRVRYYAEAEVSDAEAYMIIYINQSVSATLRVSHRLFDDAQCLSVAKR